jgi:hypothetical protein
MPTEFVAQDGAQLNKSTPIQVTGCPTSKKKTTRKASKAGKAHKSRTAGNRNSTHGKGNR